MNIHLRWIKTWYLAAIEYCAGYEFQDFIKGKWVTVAQYKLTHFTLSLKTTQEAEK